MRYGSSKMPNRYSQGAQSGELRCPISSVKVTDLLNKVPDQFSQVPDQSNKVANPFSKVPILSS